MLGPLSPLIGRPVAQPDASEILALVASEKKVAVVRLHFLRCKRQSVFFLYFYYYHHLLSESDDKVNTTFFYLDKLLLI